MYPEQSEQYFPDKDGDGIEAKSRGCIDTRAIHSVVVDTIC
jgi:hypothetical protein